MRYISCMDKHIVCYDIFPGRATDAVLIAWAAEILFSEGIDVSGFSARIDNDAWLVVFTKG